ncbi:MAG: phage tail protein [Bacteroidetes bacterium]|nr:phage tail protein [Bacteroidota bacterium]
MAGFTVNTHRFDPYKNFKFRVVWDGQVIHGIERISGLRRETEVVEHRSGSDPNHVRRAPGITQYNPIVLERGRTHDHSFEAWANLVFNLGAASGEEISLKSFRKDIEISLLNEAGQVVMSFKVYRCWPSFYEPLANLDGNGRDVMREKLVLQHEGWERDLSVQEPLER